jgi:hypothetical protein
MMCPVFHKDQCAVAPSGRALGPVSILFAFLPKLGCPLCWPVLASVCSFLGLPFSSLNPILTAFTAITAVVVIGLMVQERKIRGYAGLMAGSLLTILAYRLGGSPPWFGYLGGVGMLGAAAWNFISSPSGRPER